MNGLIFIIIKIIFLSFIRKYENEEIIIVCNFSNTIQKYRVGANEGEYIKYLIHKMKNMQEAELKMEEV